MKSFLKKAVPLLPLVSVAAVVVMAGIASTPILTGKATDRQVLDWIFVLLTGVTIGLLAEHIVGRLSARMGLPEEMATMLPRYEEFIESGLQDADLGKQRVEKTIERTLAAKTSVFKCGIAFSNMLNPENLDIWREIMHRCSVRILLLDPDWLEGQPEIHQKIADHLVRDPVTLLGQIRSSLAELRKLSTSLPSEQKARLEVRVYRGFPTMNFDLIDHGTAAQRMMIELLPYRCGFRNRPHMLIRQTESGWYDSLLTCFEARWKGATPIDLR